MVVIFGATGDLTKRKLMPALCRLLQMGCLESVRILGVGRSTMSEEEFQTLVHEALKDSKKIEHLDEQQWQKLSERLHYLAGELHLDVLVTRTYGLDEINEGLAAVAAGEVISAVVNLEKEART